MSKLHLRRFAGLVGAALVATPLATSCTSDQINAVLVGLDAAARILDDEEDDHPSFWEWLEDEIDERH